MFTQTYHRCRVVTLEKCGPLSWSQGVLYFGNSLTSTMLWSVETTNYLLSLLFFVLPSTSHTKKKKGEK
jgi:hypothetical protein